MSVITRFAPSPTGFLHIGGARTALFNWLFARHHEGKFLLRIEDTDKQRSTQEAILEIQKGLNWLGLTWDNEIIFQSANEARHREMANYLLENDLAYKCFSTPEELAEMRLRARTEGGQQGYNGYWRDKGPEDWPSGVSPTIRFKSPETGETRINDQVQGEVIIKNSQLDDMVILRSDGTPTYILAAVVDDHDMQVSHIIRGDDHLVNAARQSQLYNAFGWNIPIYAHIPLIHGSDGSKLSKRHGALAVSSYKDKGFLPESLQNYLLRLGWSHGDHEIITMSQAITWFNLKQVGKSAARFNLDKLENLNSYYLQKLPTSRALDIIVSGLSKKLGRSVTKKQKECLKLGVPGLLSRAKTIANLVASAQFYVAQRPIPLDEKAKKALLQPGLSAILNKLMPILEKNKEWEASNIESEMRDLAEQSGVKLGSLAQPLRVAVTGTTVSPSVFEVLMALGKEESMARISDIQKIVSK
ncbi:MAG: glutamate--tRNA ligase [Rhodospirillaceae bacterium]|nr:glutamate--tRNA ligase [Rhodospirillaceae bacterium]